ncbi:MAG TPA: glycosyltransferase [Mycobacteriales bacterium]
MTRQRIVVVTPDVLGERMAGPAIRAWNIAATLSAEHEVLLATTRECTIAGDGRFAVRHVDAGQAEALIARTDVWVVQGSALVTLPAIARSDAVVVVDLYDPYHLEALELSRDAPERDRRAVVHNATAVLNQAMRRGDLFLTASGKQRDFWLGALATLGRVNPQTYDEDETLGALVVRAPFGVDAAAPIAGEPRIRGVLPGVGADDLVLLWGGGLYNWFDPLTLVRAVDAVRRDVDTVRLVFMGVRHPNPRLPAQATAAATQALAADLGLTGRHVFFNPTWVPYAERGSFLLEADVGVSTHLDHVETAFSFRTRILDYLWAGLPVVATDGDVLAGVLTGAGAGVVVPPEDAAALATTLLGLLQDADRRRAMAAASRELGRGYAWPQALAPLLEFCRAPRRAPDLTDAVTRRLIDRASETVRAPKPLPGLRGEVGLARGYLREGGTRLLARRAVSRAGKLLRGRTD